MENFPKTYLTKTGKWHILEKQIRKLVALQAAKKQQSTVQTEQAMKERRFFQARERLAFMRPGYIRNSRSEASAGQ